ncbi:class I SAM-dependent methyltransferase [Peribacillus sp. SCS-26]|uniref:class I SAM-dependent methyltransferase n=1 Tax=Paraperibacillus marinus TaxID=3115295 RepID=UPI003905F570
MNYSYQDALAYFGIEGAHPGSLGLTKVLLENETIAPASRILDAGCGTGQTSAYLSSRYPCKIYAVDSHPEMIEKARIRFANENSRVKIYKAEMERLPFKPESFDLILAESSTAFSQIDRSLPEFYRVLKKEGALITIDMAAEPSLSQQAKSEIQKFYGVHAVLTESEWKKAFRLAGFKFVDVLKAATIMEEFENYVPPQGTSVPAFSPPPYNSEASGVMQMHYQLSAEYGNSLGYRVFRVSGK